MPAHDRGRREVNEDQEGALENPVVLDDAPETAWDLHQLGWLALERKEYDKAREKPEAVHASTISITLRFSPFDTD